MLSPTIDTVRVFLHILAATVWVGGQLVLAGVVGAVRRDTPSATAVIAKAYARIAWPAFAVLMVTGIWNLVEVDVANTSTEYQVTVFVKVSLAVASGVFAAIHSIGTSKLALALGGALGLLTALGATFLGVLLSA